MTDFSFDIAKGPFEPNLESLRTFQCPEWFRDAKLGIWSHWGPQSVPMYGDWYARHMYKEGSEQYRYHLRTYGHPSKFGYKDLIPLWKAENFDPDALMDLYVRAGAKYFVGQAMHHDNFDNYDSRFNGWNSVKMGPHKDICQLWKAAAKKRGLPFGVSEHLGASYTWMSLSHGADARGPYAGVPYDGADPANISLYRDNDSELLEHSWYTRNEKYHRDWYRRIKDVVDTLQPDLLYSDGPLPFGPYGEHLLAHLYNESAARNGGVNQAVYNQKNADPAMYKVGVLDIERGISGEIAQDPWQDDTSIGDWFYNVRDEYKTAEDIVDTLVDVVSKNGNLLLNVTQRPDGTLDDECLYALHKIGAWIKDNGRGIFATRPYVKMGEGEAALASGAFQEGTAQWTGADYRFTVDKDGGAINAFRMRDGGERRARVVSLGRVYEREIRRVTVYGEPVPFRQKDGCLDVEHPANRHPGMPLLIRAEF